jgi:hypothetical protein
MPSGHRRMGGAAPKGRQGRCKRAQPHALGRTIAWLMTIGRERPSKAETVTVATIEAGAPMLVEARDLIAAFQAMIRRRSPSDREPRLECA